MTIRRTIAVVSTATLALVGCTSRPDYTGTAVRESACGGSAIDAFTAAIVRALERTELGDRVAGTAGTECGGAEDCDAYLSCRGIDASRPCDPATTPARCTDDTHLELCVSVPSEGGRVQTIDCAREPSGNSRCVDTDLVSTCGVDTCTEGPPRCEGNAVLTCAGGVLSRLDCSRLGRTCAAGAGRATCVDVVETCEADLCDGDVALDCDEGLGFNRTDCAALIGPTGACEMVAGSATCVSTDPECEQGTGECAGDVIRYCVNGVYEEFDCGAFQGATCVEGEGGLFGDTLRCEL